MLQPLLPCTYLHHHCTHCMPFILLLYTHGGSCLIITLCAPARDMQDAVAGSKEQLKQAAQESAYCSAAVLCVMSNNVAGLAGEVQAPLQVRECMAPQRCAVALQAILPPRRVAMS